MAMAPGICLSELIRKEKKKKTGKSSWIIKKGDKKHMVAVAGTCVEYLLHVHLLHVHIVAIDSQEPVLLYLATSEDHTLSSCMQLQGRDAKGRRTGQKSAEKVPPELWKSEKMSRKNERRSETMDAISAYFF